MSEPSTPSELNQASDTSTAEVQGVSKPTDIPRSFPQKRRGRPPGRPNTTVKEADYEDNTAVQQWNVCKVDNPIAAVAINIRDAFAESLLTRDPQRAIFKLPSREFIYFVQGWITSRQIASQRPSYVNGLLIHSRGKDSPRSCDQCAEKRTKNALGPFLTCRVLPGHFHDSCSNCKWFDTTSSCSLFTGSKPNRKRKAKGGGEEDAAAGADSFQNVDPALTPAGLSSAPEQSEVPTTSAEASANDADLSVLVLSEQDLERSVKQDNGFEEANSPSRET
jgi:hypothetical protein